jgi:hypothetical protein
MFPLVLGDLPYHLPHLSLCQTCDLFFKHNPSQPYHITTRSDPLNFQTFLKAIAGEEIEITGANYSDLLHLADEFQCSDLQLRVAAFRESPQHRISLLEDRIQRQEQTICDLRTSLTSALSAVSTLSRDVGEVRGFHARHETAITELRVAQLDRAGVAAIVKEELSAPLRQLRTDITRETDNKFLRDIGELHWSQTAHEVAIAELRTSRIDRAGVAAIVNERLSAQLQPLRIDITRETDEKLSRSKSENGTAVSNLGTRVSTLENWRPVVDSRILSYFPAIFNDFHSKRFSLLWRGSRDGFSPSTFHERCDRHANTLTLIEDTTGAVFGGFTPVAWESRGPWNKKEDDGDNCRKGDPSGTSFLFRLKHSTLAAPAKFALTDKGKAIWCSSERGPSFGYNLFIPPNCNTTPDSTSRETGNGYATDGGQLAGTSKFTVWEIEVFELID